MSSAQSSLSYVNSEYRPQDSYPQYFCRWQQLLRVCMIAVQQGGGR